MAKGRAQKETQRYLERVSRSVDAERQARLRAREAREERRKQPPRQLDKNQIDKNQIDCGTEDAVGAERAARLTRANEEYGTFWCSTVALKLPDLVHNLLNGVEQTASTRSMRLKVYNRVDRRVEIFPVIDLLNLLEQQPLQEGSVTNSQIRLHGGLHIAAPAYHYMRHVWNSALSSRTCEGAENGATSSWC